jgi:hypothetical protein
VITEEGIAALRHAWPIYARGIAQYFAHWLTEEEARLFESALERIVEAASQKP